MSTFEQRALAIFIDVVDLPTEEQTSALMAIETTEPALAARVRGLLGRDAQPSPLDAAAPAALGALIGDPTDIGAYRVVRRLGEGGMGTVYLAERDIDGLRTQVAIKLIRRDRVSGVFLSRFLAERRHLAALDHPGICRFIDASSLPDGSPYVVLEAIDGEPLLQYCERHRLGLRARVELLAAIVDAVAHAHDRLVIHRDIKPSNVLVTADGTPKLLDFGIAKSLTDSAATGTAERFLTPSVSAPEQWLGQAVGVASDVYGLGVLAYELLAGRAPFDFQGLRAAEIEKLILHVAPAPVSDVSRLPFAAQLRGDLDAIVGMCLHKTPTQRFANAAALEADLQRYLQQRPIQARRTGVGYRAALFVRRHRLPVALTAVAGVLLVVGVTALWFQAGALERERNTALLERDRAREVVSILRESFLGADPARSTGDRVTARSILDAATPRVIALKDTQPLLFAELAEIIASVEAGLAADSQALALAGPALALPATALSPEVELRLLRTSAIAHARSGDIELAQSMVARMQALEFSPSIESRLVAARVEMDVGLSERADELLKALIRDLGDRSQNDDLAFEARFFHAENLRTSGRPDESSVAFRELAQWLTGLPEDHPKELRVRTRLLMAEAQSGNAESALTEFDELVTRLEGVYGNSSVVAADARSAFAGTLIRAGRLENARHHYSEALERYRAVLGPNHISTIRLQFNLVVVLSRIDAKSVEAIAAAKDVVDRSVQALGPHRPMTVYARTLLASLHLARSEHHAALLVMGVPESSEWHKVEAWSNLTAQRRTVERILHTGICAAPSDPDISIACGRIGDLATQLVRELANAPEA